MKTHSRITTLQVTSFLFVVALLLLPSVSSAQISLTTFGSSVAEFGDWTYTSATSTISGTADTGDSIFPNDSPDPAWDFTSVGAPASLVLNLTGFVTQSPGGGFSITIGDSLGNETVTLFNWSSFGTSSSVVSVSLSTVGAPDAMDWTSINNWNLTSGSAGDINATFTKLEVALVPEPSTYALLALSGLAFGGYIIRRRRRA
jgi:hypothetical protein